MRHGTQVTKYRIEFFKPHNNPDKGWVALGQMTLALLPEQEPNVMGIAFKRAEPRQLEATMLRIYKEK